MGAIREKVDRLIKLLPDPQGVADGNVVTTQTYVDERGITQYGYVLTPGGGGGSGTVTSIDVSGGTTGLTTSGGPVTTSGVITLAGTLAIANGGTGQTTAPNAINALLPSQGGNSGKVLGTNGTVASWVAAGGSGTVTSVALAAPGEFTVSGSPVTTTGTLTLTKATQTANTVWAGPTTGAAAQPAFRALVDADLPAIAKSKRGPGCVFTNGGLLLSGTLTSEIEVPYAFNGTGWTIVGDVAGSATVTITRSTYANYDTMSALLTATVTTAIKNQATGLTFTLSAGDIIRFSAGSFSGFTRCSIQLDGTPA